MKKNLAKLIFTLVISSMLVGVVPVSSYAMESVNTASSEVLENNDSRTRQDEIYYVFYVDQNNVVWKRLWNYTKGVWVDADWQKA